MGTYRDMYEESISDPEGFWGRAAEDIHWFKGFDQVLDDSQAPFYKWFVGGEMNTCYNSVDYHVQNGRKDQLALIYDSPVTGVKKSYTFGQLQEETAQFAGLLRSVGVEKGDRVIIYMPMIPEALISMLGCARIGAIHSVVFGGFASTELASRVEDAKPKVIVSASCGIEGQKIVPYKPLLDKSLEISEHKPDKCIILQRDIQRAELLPERDLDWREAIKDVEPADTVSVKSTDPLYILYTSGTTGLPKGIVRDNGGHAVALKWSMKYIYGIEPGDVFWAASDVGWVVGHSYIVYAPLFLGATTVIYEGKPVGTPDAGEFWRIISEYGVKVLFTAPTAFRAIKKEDPEGEYFSKYDLSQFRALFLAGERTDPDTYHWATQLLQRPVIDHWWQTETGWPIVANFMGSERFMIKPGSPSKPVPGYQVQILDEDGSQVAPEKEGAVAIKLPLPPGTMTTLWQRDDKCKEVYYDKYPGYYLTGDGGYIDSDGYVYIMGRIDDIIIVAGHNLSTGSIEEVVSSHPAVAECAVIGVADALKTQVPVGFVVLKGGVSQDHEEIKKELVQMVREGVGPVANFKQVLIVDRLPKTRSGKILRRTMRNIADAKDYKVPSTIDDPAILEELTEALQGIGYARYSSATIGG